MTIDGVFCGGIIELDNPVHSTLEESYPIKWLPNPNQKTHPVTLPVAEKEPEHRGIGK